MGTVMYTFYFLKKQVFLRRILLKTGMNTAVQYLQSFLPTMPWGNTGLVVGPLHRSICPTLLECLVCVIYNSKKISFLYIQTLYNDCSYIEAVRLLFCVHVVQWVVMSHRGRGSC